MNSVWRIDWVWVRTIRAYSGMEVTTTIRMMVCRLGPITVTMASANITVGNARTESNISIRTVEPARPVAGDHAEHDAVAERQDGRGSATPSAMRPP